MRFDYHRPTHISEALKLLAQPDEKRRPIAYGSDLLVWTKDRALDAPEAVVDLTGVPELGLVETRDDHLFIGSCATLAELARAEILRARFPALAAALGTMGSVQLREGASLGGNMCTASPAGDSAPPLLCYEASMLIAGAAGERRVPARDFYLAPGKTALEPGELVVGVELPWPADGASGVYLKGARRAAVDLALVSVAAVAWPSTEAPAGVEMRMALGAVAPTPVRAPRAEEVVRDKGLGHGSSSKTGQLIARAARESARPIDDVRASARYRTSLVGELASRAAARLAEALAVTEKKGD